jgi:hypothetical protein
MHLEGKNQLRVITVTCTAKLRAFAVHRRDQSAWNMSDHCASLNRLYSQPLNTKGDKVGREEAAALPLPVPEP